MCERFGVTTTFTTEGGDRTTMNQIIERKRAHERYVHLNLCIGNQTDPDATGFICLQFHPFKGVLRRGRRGDAGENADDEAVDRDEGRAGEERDR